MGNLLEFRIDGTDSNNIKYSANELEEFFLQLKTTDENTNKNIYNIEEITITNGDKNIYYQNLKHFTNLKKLSINDTKLEVMPIEITELINLKYFSGYQVAYNKYLWIIKPCKFKIFIDAYDN